MEADLAAALERAREVDLPVTELVGCDLEALLSAFQGPGDWTFSELTGSGYPVELVFTSARDGMGYTAEVAGARSGAQCRISAARSHWPPREASRVDAMVRPWVSRHGWPGAVWLGRHHGRRPRPRKLYLAPVQGREVASGRGRTESGRAGPPRDFPLPALPTPQLEMWGLLPESGTEEVYLQVNGMLPWQLEAQLGRVGLAGCWAGLVHLLEVATERRVERGLPATRMGLSWRPEPASMGSEVGGTLTLFVFARALFGSDARIRKGILRLAGELGWDATLYGAVSRPLTDSHGRQTHHGLVGFALTAGGIALQVGVRPPPGAGG